MLLINTLANSLVINGYGCWSLEVKYDDSGTKVPFQHFNVLLYFNVLLHNNRHTKWTNQHLMSCCIILGHFRKLLCCTNELCSADPFLPAAIATSNDPILSTNLLHNPSTSDHNYYCHSQNTWAPAWCTRSCQPKRLATAHSLSTYNMKKKDEPSVSPKD
jgi:hypothetical protein